MKTPEAALDALDVAAAGRRAAGRGVAPWRQPWLARLLRSRAQCLTIPVVFGVFGLLVALGFEGWSCPLLAAAGVPCPGCGMSRSLLAGLAGDWRQMLAFNPAGPAFGLLLGGLAVAGLLPSRWRLAVADRIDALERRFAPLLLLVALLAGLWLVRAGGLVISALSGS